MKLSKYLKPYWFFALLAPILMIGEVAVDLFQPRLMAVIVDEGVLKGDMGLVIRTGILMLVLVIFGGGFGVLCAYFASRAAQGFGRDLRNDSFKKIMSLSIEQTDKFTTGSLVTRMTNDVSMLQELVQMALRMFVRAPMFFVGGSIMMLTLDVKFSIIAIIGLPILAGLIFIFLHRATPLFGEVQKRIDKVNSVVQENVSGARVIKAYVREDYENARFDKANKGLYDVNYRVMTIMCLLSPLMMIVMNFAVIAVIYIGGFEAAAQRMKPGTIMAAVTYLTQIFHSVMMLNNIFQTISRSSASAKRVVEVLETEPIISSGELESGDGESEYSIEFNGVDFRYPSAVGRPVLEGINLKIKRGETLAIIGATGSGKSSLVKLIPRFYDANKGSILVDGRDVREYDLTALRKKIGFVMQKSELFSDTILNNIKWGREDASDEEIARAAKLAEADGFITSFSDGYNTFVAEKGASLSGGQKQRISIARALVRHPEILILDDSTSALDLATEGKVRRALKEEFKDSTVLMIAQRIASVKDADRIAVIDGGRIVACDTHERLLEYCNEYQEIYSSQMKSGAYIESAVSSGADIEGGVSNE